jgi:S1-C subfamily serine protease
VQQFGRIVRPWLGVRYVLVSAETGSEAEGLYETGALIVSGSQPGEVGVFAGSPADLAGLREEDIITAIEGQLLTQDQTLAELISDYRPGDVVTITVVRGTQRFDVQVALAEYGE